VIRALGVDSTIPTFRGLSLHEQPCVIHNRGRRAVARKGSFPGFDDSRLPPTMVLAKHMGVVAQQLPKKSRIDIRLEIRNRKRIA
jgi:hypothetical protein